MSMTCQGTGMQQASRCAPNTGYNYRRFRCIGAGMRKHGWELHRDGCGLQAYRIRQPGECTRRDPHGPLPDAGGFQAFDADHAYGSFSPPPYKYSKEGRILEDREHDDMWAGPVRTLWKDAVKDLFGYRAPGAEPIF